MPPAKKPAARRQRRNRTDVGLVAVASAEVAAPAAAEEWLDATADRWFAFWRSELAALVKADSDEPALRRLFAYYDELERSLGAFREQRFVRGSMGQPRLNPLADHIRALEPLIRALEDRFGLTPLARLKLGVEFASAHKSLEELNHSLADDAEDEDPRLEVIEGSAS